MMMNRIKDLTSNVLDRVFRDATASAREEALEADLAITGTNERGSLVTLTDDKPLQGKKKGRRVA